MPCTRALPHLALELRFSRFCVFRHCFATVCTCSRTTCRLYQQCPNSCRGFIPNASLNLLWIKAFAINSLSTIRIRVSPDRNIHYLHTVLLQCACARTPHADSTSSVRVAAAPSCPMHQLRMPCTRSLPHLALEFRFSRFCVFRHCFATVCTCSRTTCRLYQQCPNSCRGFIPNASLNLLWIKAFAINSLSTIRIRVSPDRNIHFRWPIVLLFTDILDYLHTVLLQCACARTPTNTACRLYQQCQSSCSTFMFPCFGP